jgi:serine protease AprX
MRSTPARGVSKRVFAVCLAAAVAAATLVGAGPAQARPTTAAAEPPARPLGASGVWSATGWTSSTGTPVSDVVKIIGSDTSGLDGRGVGIALIDTGVAPVPGLPAAQVVNGPDLSFDSQAPHLRYLDEYGHGTHLAGIIVGDDPATGLRGIAPKAKLTSIKVGAAGGVVDVTQVLAALDWVVQHRNDDPANPIKVVALAYGTDAFADWRYDPLYFAVENAYRNGILVVVAGGNAGTSLGRLNSPAQSSLVMQVGSANTKGTISAADDTLSTFTSTTTGMQLDVVAPGEGLVSARVPGSGIDAAFPGARVGENLFRGSGSSQATAVAAGAAALLFQKAPTATPHHIRTWIRDSARPVTGTNASRTMGELSISNALKMPVPSGSLGFAGSDGLGSIETARGNIHVVHNSATLSGVKHIFGSFNNSTWVTAAKNRTAWNGGVWLGKRMAGDGWTGSSWASKTWAGTTWQSTDWAGQAWADSAWNGRYWAGRYWATGDWSGRYWASSTWQTNNYSAKSWSSYGWY